MLWKLKNKYDTNSYLAIKNNLRKKHKNTILEIIYHIDLNITAKLVMS